MKKILFLVLGCMFSMTAMADDLSCGDMQSKINELSAQENLSDDDSALLSSLRLSYRTDCAKRQASRSYVSHSTRGTVQKKIDTGAENLDAVEADDLANEVVGVVYDAEKCNNLKSEINASSDDDKVKEYEQYCAQYVVEPELTDEELRLAEEAEAQRIADLLAQGLCPDGNKPNRFGCCAGEKFTDMGNLEFACCVDETNECFPPVVRGAE
ncbi:MAG: hypothetical protein ACLRFJ_00865 [Alphaproteobacteria bacterium]